MKKNVIALLLAVVMASGSIGTVPVMAAETTAQEAVAVEEETVEETEEIPDETDAVEVSETTAEETVAVEEGTVGSEEALAETETVTDETAEYTSEEKSAEEIEAVPEQDLAESVEETEEIETTEDEEPAVTEEEAAESEGKEATLAESDDVVASGKCGNNITWQLDTGGRLVLDGEGDMYKYVNPSVQGEKVPWESYIETTKMVTSVEISEGITSISPYAFYTCYGDYDNVHEVTIPSTITSIGESAFYGWGGVEELWMPKNLKAIGSYAFAYSSISSIHMEDEIQKIGSYAFYQGNLSKVYGYENSYAETYAKNNSKEFISIGVDDEPSIIASGKCGNNITWQLDTGGRLVLDGEGDMYKYVNPSVQGEKVPWESYIETTKMVTSVEISEGITSISPYAFYTCYGDYDNVHEVTIPSTITSIGESAFYVWGGSREVYFKGGAPKGVLEGLTATAYYPVSDPSWTEDVRQNYGGTITWVPWNPTESPGDDKELTIVSATPNDGDLNVDHALKYYSIKFNENISYANEGYAYLYDVSNDSIPVAKALISRGDDEHLNEQSLITGMDTLEIRFPFNVELGHEYFIKIDADCIKKDISDIIIGGEEDLEEIYFKGITDDQSWRFKTCAVDYMHFTNLTDKIHESVYHVLFKPIYASWIRMKDDGTNGTCFGWAYTVGAKANGYNGINGFSDSLMNLEKDSRYGATDFSFLEYVQYAHLYQYTSEKTDEKLRKNKYSDLFNAIKASINGTGPKIIINVFGKKGHAVYPLSILEENDSEVRIQVINPNENVVTGSHLSILTLKRENGSFNGFEMGDYDKSISYCTIDVTADWAFSTASAYMSDNNMVHSSVSVNNSDLQELECCGDDDVNEDGLHLYWYDGKQVNTSLGSDDQIGITDGYKDISVTAGDDADISLDLNEMTSTVECLSDTSSEYEISYVEATGEDDTNTITVTATTSESIVSQMTSDGLVIQSSGSEGIFIETDDLSIKAPTNGDDVLITTNDDNGVEVLKDSDNDGSFDEQIEVEILSGDEKQISESMLSNIENKEYTGEEIEQDPIMTEGDKELVQGTDYTVSYENNINAGTATITITGIGSYIGTVERTFEITPKAIIPTVTLSQTSFTYNGMAQMPSVTVSYNGKQLKEGVDYNLVYDNNIEPGTASVIVTCIGNYSGSATKDFTIIKEIVLTGSWQKNSKGWWYRWSDGSYPKSKFENISGKTYYFNSSGYMVTGWQNIGGAWYYFSGSGAMATGWQSIGGKWYYMSGSGVMRTGLQNISGKTYYFSAGGAMATGWQKINNKWYYFSGSGAMLTGWQKISNKWYYFDANGAMLTGWQSIGGKWYYFEGSGVMAANKWVGNYYLTGSGAMATNTWIGKYYVGADGKWIPNYKATN